MVRPRHIILAALTLAVSLLSLPVTSQLPSPGTKPPLKSMREVQALNNAGNKALNANPSNVEAAQRLYNQALDRARTLRDRIGEGKSLLNLGNVSAIQKQPAKALDYLQQSLAVSRETHDAIGEADTLYTIARLYSKFEPDKAEDAFRQARSAYHEAGQPAREAETLILIGNFHQKQGRIRQAKEAYTIAATFAHSTGNEKAEADALWARGALHKFTKGSDPDMPTMDEAKKDYLKAKMLFHKVNDLVDEAWTDGNLGVIEFFQGHTDAYRQDLQQALGIYRTLKDTKNIASTLSKLGLMTGVQDLVVESLRYEQEALGIYRAEGDKTGESKTLLRIAGLYINIGQQRTALRQFLQALPLVRETGDTDNLISVLLSIGEIYNILGEHQTAKKYYVELDPLLDKPISELGRLNNLKNRAAVYFELGEFQKARDTLVRELENEQKSGATVLIPSTIDMLAQAESELGHTDRALELYRQELHLTEGTGDNITNASILSNIAQIEDTQGRLAVADENLNTAVAMLERIRASLSGLSEAKSTFLNKSLDTYKQYLVLLLRRNKSEEAFALVQKMKARVLLDILYDGKVQLAGSLTPEEWEHEKILRQKSDTLNYQLVKEGVQNEIGSRKRAETIKLQITDAERELQVYEDSLYVRHPDLATARAAKTIALGEVAKFLPENTAILEYVTLKVGKTDETVLFVVTNNAGTPEVSTHIFAITQIELTKRVDALRDACADPRKSYLVAARSLYQTLVAPAQTRIAGKKRLLICPDGILWDVPFAALLAGSNSMANAAAQDRKFLIQLFEIVYAYSATGAQAELTAQARGDRRRPTKTMLAFADPDFGDEQRFGDRPGLTGERPIHAASRPIHAASRYAKWPTRPIHAASRPIHAASRPIHAASRRIHAATRRILAGSRPISAASRGKGEPTRPIHAASRANADASRPIHAASRANAEATRPITAASREILVPRGGKLSQLPGTLLEAQAVREDFTGAAVFTGASAQEATVKREAGKYRYLHFATHGFFNDAAPLLSAIVLALPDEGSGEDGFLTAREIFDLDLHADMVVLSACNTAKGEKRSGEGIIGLTWALFAAGAPTQVVSQWSVNDASTAQLMKRFYSNLTRKHMEKGEALRQAALFLLLGNSKLQASRPRYVHPYYWAPFILIGNWAKDRL